MLLADEALLAGVPDPGEQGVVVAIEVHDAHRLEVVVELGPGGHLGQLFQGPEAPREGDERIRELSHHHFARVHAVDDKQLRQICVSQLQRLELPGDDPIDLAALRQSPLSDLAHQADSAATVDDPKPATGERRAHLKGDGFVARMNAIR